MARDDSNDWREAAKANIQQARKTHGRLGSKKSRSGCVTCKIRRVKCDEAQPACQRCTSTGRQCDGYADVSPRSKSPGSVVSTVKPLGLKPHEIQTLDYFISVTAPQLSGGLDSDFWTRQLLQICHAEPFVLEAVLSISTLHRHPQYLQSFSVNLEGDEHLPRYEKLKALSTGDPFGNEKLDEHHATALRSYNRSIAMFRKRLQSGQMSASLVLLSCFLFITIEIIRDSVVDALALFTQSMQLARTLVVKDDPLTELLSSAMARLSVLAGTFGVTGALGFAQDSPKVIDDQPFTSLIEARSALFGCMSRCHFFFRDAEKYKSFILSLEEEPTARMVSHMSEFASAHPPITGLNRSYAQDFGFRSETTTTVRREELANGERNEGLDDDRKTLSYEVYNDDSPPSVDSGFFDGERDFVLPQDVGPWLDSMAKRERQHDAEFDDWYESFHKLRSNLDNKEAEAASHLLMYYHVSKIWLASRLEYRQSAFDDCTYHFQQILIHAEVYINARVAAGSHFTFEMGAIPPLFLTATKCRIPSLRRKALSLLKKGPRKESIWGAQTAGQVAATLVWLEEVDLGLPMPEDPVDHLRVADLDARLPSEARRVHNTQIWKNNPELRFELQVTRYHYDINGRRRRIETNVPIDAGSTKKDSSRPSEADVAKPMRKMSSSWADQDFEFMEGAPGWVM